MAIFLLVFALMILSAVALALGVVFGRGPLQNGCNAAVCAKRIKCADCPNRSNGSED